MYNASMENSQRECKRCNKSKPLSEFNKRGDGRGGGYNSYCRVCDREYSREHYQKNKEYYRKKRLREQQKVRAKLREYKSECACEICGEDHPDVLDFHHKSAEEKDGHISRLASSRGWSRVLKEIEKCQVLCSNCHRKLHAEERMK